MTPDTFNDIDKELESQLNRVPEEMCAAIDAFTQEVFDEFTRFTTYDADGIDDAQKKQQTYFTVKQTYRTVIRDKTISREEKIEIEERVTQTRQEYIQARKHLLQTIWDQHNNS